MGGITFFGTENLDRISEFYIEKIGMELWLNQPGCRILKYKNMLLGFCSSKNTEKCGVITLFCHTKADVDIYYARFADKSISKPCINKDYNIYNFFARDPDGRKIEFQTFLHRIEPYMDGCQLLKTRRSIRHFSKEPVSMEIIEKIAELCRYSPTSRNTQGYYFLIIKNQEKIDYLASLRGSSSDPIRRAPMAVAVCSDPSVTKRPEDDGIIASYHFILSAALHGLGTCWIAAMNINEAKECLQIPENHYIATITPLGYPSEDPDMPERKDRSSFCRVID